MDSNRDEALIWWEKTVEYQFVIEILTKINEGAAFAPLDGNQEKAGDLLFANSNYDFLIIEFKRDNSEDTKKRERNKYNNFNRAIEDLSEKSSGHYVIFGEPEEKDLVLKYSKYWLFLCNENDSQKLNGNWTNIEYFNKNKFVCYVNELINAKKEKPISSGGSTETKKSTSVEDLNSVVMIFSDGKIKQVADLCDITEIILQMEHGKSKELKGQEEQDELEQDEPGR